MVLNNAEINTQSIIDKYLAKHTVIIPDEKKDKPHCSECNNSGWIQIGWYFDGKVRRPNMTFCANPIHDIPTAQARVTGIPRAYRSVTEKDVYAPALAKIRSLDEHTNLYIQGEVSGRKTALAALLGLEATRSHRSVAWYYVPDLFDSFKDKLFSKSEEGKENIASFMQTLYQYDLLILDSFGSGETSEFLVGRLTTLIHRRVELGRQTIITSDSGQSPNRYKSDALIKDLVRSYVEIKVKTRKEWSVE